MDLAKVRHDAEQYQWCHGSTFGRIPRIMSRRIAPYHVVAYDFGVKRNILRLLSDLDCRLTVVPATTTRGRGVGTIAGWHISVERPGDPSPVTTR